VSEQDQEKAAKRAQWEEINRAKALAKQQQKDAAAAVATGGAVRPAETKKQFQAVKGTRDLLPPDTSLWNHVERTAHEVFGTFGFGEIRVPVLEPTDLFARAVGGDTDIVSKEMYTFEDHDFANLERLRAQILGLEFDLVEAGNFGMFLTYIEKFTDGLRRGMEKKAIPLTLGNILAQKDLDDYLSRFENVTKGRPNETILRAPNFDADFTFVQQALSRVKFGEVISLRPEATASVCRAYIEHNLNQQPQPVKLYYTGPMFRRERPQKGRYRQFYQIGAEVLGGNEAPAIDAEVIEMVMTFFDKLELPGLELNINSIGHNAPDCRPKYVELLRTELHKVKDQLGPDSQRRIETNPLRVLDSKLESEQAIIATLPHIADHLCDACNTDYADVKNQLQLRGVIYHENWRLVRGLDYYMRTTFEITAKGLGSQNAVCGGGRYDGLVELLGGPQTKGIGFAIGEDRLILSLQDAGKVPAQRGRDIYIAWMGEHAYPEAVRIAKFLRTAGFSVELPPTEQKFGKALERAARLDSRYALILGDNEVSEGMFTLKTLADGSQEKFTGPDLLEFLKGHQ
jgi:histidyl-tRNA synthetase